jgi:hypothetical protein
VRGEKEGKRGKKKKRGKRRKKKGEGKGKRASCGARREREPSWSAEVRISKIRLLGIFVTRQIGQSARARGTRSQSHSTRGARGFGTILESDGIDMFTMMQQEE